MLYHYTQLKNLNKIFCKEHIRFRMYDSRWMNDPSESKVLQDYILKYQEDILKELSAQNRDYLRAAINVSSNVTPLKTLPNFTYVLSFSMVRDSNIFWGSKYSGLNGFSMTIDESYLKQQNFMHIGHAVIDDVYYFNSIEGDANNDDVKHVSAKLDQVISKIKNNKEIDVEVVPYAIWDSIMAFHSIFHKHPSWAHEKEKRFVIITKAKTTFIGIQNGKVSYFPSGIREDGLNLYSEHTKIDFDNNLFPRPFIEIEMPKDSIKNVILGPNFTEIDIESVRNYFYKLSYIISVLPSGAQIR